jgi:hypothetical protein
MTVVGLVLLALAVLGILVPLVLAIPLVLVALWTGVALLVRAYQLRAGGKAPS